jgi:peptidoglycan-N-acetylglucosamine deacetylase
MFQMLSVPREALLLMLRSMRCSFAVALLAFAVCGVTRASDTSPKPAAGGPPLPVQLSAEQDHRPKVALTFDDLPAHGPVPAGRTRIELMRDIVGALRTAHAPAVYGLVNAKGIDSAPENMEILKLWRSSGFLLGNHTLSHMDLDTHTVAEFEQDVLADEPTLRNTMADADWHWFRYPYLHMGETKEKRHAVAAMLKRHGYRVAQVTLNFDDWAYHTPYARCVGRDDQAAIAWLKETYLAQANAAIDAGQKASQLAYGRDIKHVMLLHAGGFNAVMLPSLLALLKERGFQLVTLDEAESDPAYAAEPDVFMPSGATLLDKMMAAKQIPRPAATESPLAKLQDVCR